MCKRKVLLIAALGLLFGPVVASAATVDCGTDGSADVVQTAVSAIGSTPGTLTVTGTCVGDLALRRTDRLTITGLSLTGNLNIDSSVLTSFPNLRLTGGLFIRNSRRMTFSNTVMAGTIQVTTGSAVSFSTLTQSAWTDSSGTVNLGFNCVSQSECTLDGFTLSGATGQQYTGITAGSGSRLNVYAGTISGFDVGVWVWNNSTAFLTPICGNLNIQSNAATGVYVLDAGMVKIESPTLATTGCAGQVSLTNNGGYGVWAEGGGNAYLYGVAIGGNSIDGVRVTNGSTARIRSSTIGAASSSGRSVRLKSQAHLYFDEHENGPAASSTLAGPVCVTGNSTVDTDNSATVVNVTTTCSSP